MLSIQQHIKPVEQGLEAPDAILHPRACHVIAKHQVVAVSLPLQHACCVAVQVLACDSTLGYEDLYNMQVCVCRAVFFARHVCSNACLRWPMRRRSAAQSDEPVG